MVQYIANCRRKFTVFKRFLPVIKETPERAVKRIIALPANKICLPTFYLNSSSLASHICTTYLFSSLITFCFFTAEAQRPPRVGPLQRPGPNIKRRITTVNSLPNAFPVSSPANENKPNASCGGFPRKKSEPNAILFNPTEKKLRANGISGGIPEKSVEYNTASLDSTADTGTLTADAGEPDG
jgi:hypothetical protein